MKFEELGMRMPEVQETEVQIDGVSSLKVRNYLPIREKGQLISWIVTNSLDEATGCFSPLRVEVCSSLGVLHWYADIEIDITQAETVYDICETTGLFAAVERVIPTDELKYLKTLIEETVADITRYNNSFAGMLAFMNNDAQGLGTQIDKIVKQIKNKEGMEQLAAIKDVVGTD